MIRYFLALAALSAATWGQTTTGTIQGRINDESGAAIPQARVTIVNEDTSIEQTTTSSAEGNFALPYVPPGVYTVTVQKAGFDKAVTTGVRLNVQQTVALNIAMKIGNVATSVEVTAAAVQLSTSTSSVASVIQGRAIVDLPLNGRNPFALANLVPGVIPQSNGSNSYTPWISGGRNASSEITIDGTSVILPENNVSINQTGYTPIVDSVAEFSVISNALAAEYGRTGGGVINVATRSGTNDFHGGLFEFLRNSVLDANSWANNRNGVARAAFQRNQFGGSIGGPLSIPKIYSGRNRTFFFFAEQSTRTRSASNGQASVPIDAWRRGDFSNLRNGSGQPITIYDPTTVFCESACDTSNAVYARLPFAGNIIPAERFDPVARKLLGYWPQPNALPTNQFTYQNNFFASGKAPSQEDKIDSRIDHNFSDKFRVYGRGSYSLGTSTSFNGFGNIATSIGSGFNSTDQYNISLNGVYTFSPTTVLNMNYGFARQVIITRPFSQGIDLTTLGFSQAVQNAAATQNLEFPDFTFGGNTNVSKLGQATYTTLNMVPYSHIIRPDVTKVFSRHTIKFGGEFRKMFMNFRQHGQPSGSFSFSSAVTQRVVGAATSQTQGNGFASFLLGIPASGTMEHTYAIATASAYFGFYVQDDWKITRKLTLNIGLRYDVDVPRTERYNRLSYFDIDAPSPIAGKVPGFPNLKGAMRFATPDHRHQTPTDLNNWGPRFGFAYQATPKTVFRGAYGIMYSGSVMQAAGTSGSAGTEGFRGSTNMIVSSNGGRTFDASLSNPYPNGFNFPLGAPEGPYSGASTNLGLGIGESFFNDYRNPVIQQWNTTIQREIGRGFVLEVGYLGSKGNHLIDGESSMSYNQLPASYFALGNQLLSTNQVPNPFYGIITNPNSTLSRPTIPYNQLLRPYPQYTSLSAFRKPQANSTFHSFTLRGEKRFSDGLTALISFTAGKLIDDASQTVTFLGEAGTKQDFYNRAAERSISAQDVSRRLVISADYQLPIGRGKAMLTSPPKAVDFVLGGWQLNGILTFQTGVPLKISNGGNFTNLGSPGQRPNNNGHSGELENPTMDRYFNTSVFSQAGNFTFGNTSRTSPDLRTPSQNNLDASIFKRFHATERANFEFRAEAFNATNHPTWNAPGTDVSNVGSFGVITAKGGSRVMQLALKLLF